MWRVEREEGTQLYGESYPVLPYGGGRSARHARHRRLYAALRQKGNDAAIIGTCPARWFVCGVCAVDT